MKIKKTLKIILGIIVFLTLPSILFFGFLFFKYNENLPTGNQGKEADFLAHKMLEVLNYDAYKNTSYIEWTFKKRHHFKWKKYNNTCSVYWEDNKVDLNLNNLKLSKAYLHGFKVEGDIGEKLMKKAISYFYNDSFWLVAPYKVFDDGTERRLVKLKNGNNRLLVTYTKGGTTPGDSYLWILNKDGFPESFKMWTSVIPIQGLESSWSNWTTTESGAKLPTFHNILFLGLEITNIKATK